MRITLRQNDKYLLNSRVLLQQSYRISLKSDYMYTRSVYKMRVRVCVYCNTVKFPAHHSICCRYFFGYCFGYIGIERFMLPYAFKAVDLISFPRYPTSGQNGRTVIQCIQHILTLIPLKNPSKSHTFTYNEKCYPTNTWKVEEQKRQQDLYFGRWMENITLSCVCVCVGEKNSLVCRFSGIELKRSHLSAYRSSRLWPCQKCSG